MSGVIDGTGRVTDQDRRGARGIEQADEVPVRRSVDRIDEIPELDGELVLACRLAVGEHGPRSVAGRDGRRQGSTWFAGCVPMVGHFDQSTCLGAAADRGPTTERPRVCSMETATLGWQELVVGGLLDQRMAEPVALVRGPGTDHEQLRLDRFAHARRELGVGQSADLCEDVVADLASCDRRDLDEVGGRLRGRCQSNQEHPAKRVGQAVSGTHGRIRSRDQLLGEERIPVRPPGDRVEQGRGRRCADDPGQKLDQLVALEAAEVESLDPRLPFRLGQPGGQRVSTVELIGAEGADDEQPLVARVAPQEGEEVAGRPVRPVEILDDEEDRAFSRQTAEQVEEPFEDPDLEPVVAAAGSGRGPVAVGRRRRQLRDEAGEDRQGRAGCRGDGLRIAVAGQRSQDLDDRTERKGVVAERHRSALEHKPAVVAQPGRGLGDQPALADPSLTADEHDGRADRRRPLPRS